MPLIIIRVVIYLVISIFKFFSSRKNMQLRNNTRFKELLPGFKQSGSSVHQLKKGRWPAWAAKGAGYSIKELKEAGYSARALKMAGFSKDEVESIYSNIS